ncbi:DNA polymerase IV [Paenibacillus agilis]|uniref:DNA polymerase IV n=1 Tax=Paenibacillus agilis TaxID=3020863 RepID=A0A559ICY3_9BACL|nr:DNA polymerase IV [Paenibacillus agilis]TVX85529.1 DNA polymerase IV [Paenibacillus agilis]
MSAKKKERIIYLLDCESFYASVEKAHQPQFKHLPLIVCGDPARRNGIVLAACPIAKSYGISTADRLWEALNKCPDVIVVRPRMQLYITVSMQITEILETYTDLVEPYSIDEVFIDVTNSIHLFKMTPEELAADIQKTVLLSTGVRIRAGLSNCKIMAKLATDLVAKKNKSGIFTLTKERLPEAIWPHPVEKMWGVGSRMKRNLNRIGIRTIGDLANTPLPRLAKWGVNGKILWRVANGLDESEVTTSSHVHQKAIGNGLTLPIDFVEAADIEICLLEISSWVTRRCRSKKLMASVVSVSCVGADWDRPTGFSRQQRLPDPTHSTDDIYAAVKKLFHKHWDGQPVRRLGVSVSDLSDDSVYQITLFDNQEQKRKLDAVMDSIKDKFGETAILRASSFTSAGQSLDRDRKIGGHFK